MRDDLHKTVPLSRRWGRVLRSLSAEKWSAAELAPLIVATVRKDLATDGDAGGRAVVQVLSESVGDLFGDGEEKMRMNLLNMQDGNLSPPARFTCEIALGVLAKDGMSDEFSSWVIQKTGELHARDQIEHIAARVAVTHNHKEASQVRRALMASLTLCDFSGPAPTKFVRRRKSMNDLLATELTLQDERFEARHARC